MTDLRVLSLWQPWATLWADPALPKTIETRPKPVPSTIPLPAWVLIHAAAKVPERIDIGAFWTECHTNGHDFRLRPSEVRLPLGAVIGAAHITECLPIISVDPGDTTPAVTHDGLRELWVGEDGLDLGTWARPPAEAAWGDWRTEPFTADLPYGDFTPGRWGYLTDRTVLFPAPIPWRGAQGWQRATPELIAQTKEYLT